MSEEVPRYQSGRKVRRDAFIHGSQRRAVCGHCLPCGCATVAELVGTPTICCLNCPLPECVFTGRIGGVKATTLDRLHRIAELRATGMSADDIAAQIAITRRRVFGLLQEARKRQ